MAIRFDENLREIPLNPRGFRECVNDLEKSFSSAKDPKEQVRVLGELGSHLRTLGDLQRAEDCLSQALALIAAHQLGVQREVQQKIRLAHVLQWKKRFTESDRLFSEVIQTCRLQAKEYLDFALQHAGKNFFDQKRWSEAMPLFQEALSLRLQRKAPADQIESTRWAIAKTEQRS